MRPSVWQVAGMEEEITAALEDDSVEEVQILEIRFNQAVKEAGRGPEDYLHEWTIPEELGGFKRMLFGDAAYLGAQKVVKWLAETAGLLPNTFKDLTAEKLPRCARSSAPMAPTAPCTTPCVEPR